MISKKKVIFDALNQVGDPVAYNDTVDIEFPRINFSLINHLSSRLSNQRHAQHTVYQVDYFSLRPLDVETDATLWKIIELLERSKLKTTDWREIADIDIEEQSGVYHYWIEVR